MSKQMMSEHAKRKREDRRNWRNTRDICERCNVNYGSDGLYGICSNCLIYFAESGEKPSQDLIDRVNMRMEGFMPVGESKIWKKSPLWKAKRKRRNPKTNEYEVDELERV